MNRISNLLIVAGAIGSIGLGGGAQAHGYHFFEGPAFKAEGLVTAVAPTPLTGSCGTAVGDIFSGVASLTFGNGQGGQNHGHNGNGGNNGPSIILRVSENNATSFGVMDEIFPFSDPHSPPSSGSYMFGMEGGTLSTGTFTATVNILGKNAVTTINTLTYTSPADGTTSCVETDQITLIRVSNSD